MTRDDIIRMGKKVWALEFIPESDVMKLERFAALVSAAERERIEELEKITGDMADAAIEVHEAVLAEREACAKVCADKVDAEYATGKVDHNEIAWTQACAIAIRARGEA